MEHTRLTRTVCYIAHPLSNQGDISGLAGLGARTARYLDHTDTGQRKARVRGTGEGGGGGLRVSASLGVWGVGGAG